MQRVPNLPEAVPRSCPFLRCFCCCYNLFVTPAPCVHGPAPPDHKLHDSPAGLCWLSQPPTLSIRTLTPVHLRSYLCPSVHVLLSICARIPVHLCMYSCPSARISVHLCTYSCPSVHVLLFICARTPVHLCTYSCPSVHELLSIYTRISVHLGTHSCPYVHAFLSICATPPSAQPLCLCNRSAHAPAP